MKKKLFNLLPSWIRNYKHGDKIAHAIGGVAIYLLLSIFLPTYIALALTWAVALGIEIVDSYTHNGDFRDFIATIILPTIIYAVFQ